MNRIKEIRERKGLSQKFIALSLGVKAPSVYEWENGKSNPSVDNLLALADLMLVSVDELLGREVSDQPEADPDESLLLANFRLLSQQGREYIRQQMDIAVRIYKKSADLSSVESQQIEGAV